MLSQDMECEVTGKLNGEVGMVKKLGNNCLNPKSESSINSSIRITKAQKIQKNI